MIGNIECLYEWGTEMPGLPLIVPNHIIISRNTRVGLQTLRSSMNTVTYHYKFRNKINEILRMRVKTKKKGWMEIQCKLRYLDIPENTKEISIPELWARYGLMTDIEREWHKKEKQVIYTEDIVIAESDNPTSLGSTDVIKLHCKVPCKALFWVSQNIKHIENRNFSNYTTKDEISNGWNPCSKASLKYGGLYRVKELTHEHFDSAEVSEFVNLLLQFLDTIFIYLGMI